MPQTASPLAATRVAPRAPRRLLPRRAVVAPEVCTTELLRFQGLMAGEGHTVQVGRMCYDRPYAFDCLALAHASACDPLRRLALSLFGAYQRGDSARTLHG